MYKKEVLINADGRGYYEYLPALFIYDDIHFGYLDTLETDYYDLEQMKGMYQNPLFERPINKYFAGTALLQSPFFAIAHLSTKATQGEFKADGFSRPYQRAILYAAIFYLFVGFIFIRKLLQTYDLNCWWILLVQLSILYCTSLFTYTMYDPAYSHVYSFALISGFLFAVRKFFISQKARYIIWTLIFLGLITIVRPVNILVVLFIPFLADSGNELRDKMKFLFLKSWKFLLLGVLAFVAVIGIQFYISYLQTGNALNYGYGDEGFNFFSPRFIDFLFSYRKGFFLWSPWWFLIFVAGTFLWVKSKHFYHLITFFLAFILIVYVSSSWGSWAYGGSHGSRPMVDFYSAFALLAIPIYHSGKKLIYALILMFSIPLAVINLIQTVQYQKSILFWDLMDKDKYWQVFLNTNDKYIWYFWRDTIEIGKKQAETILFEGLYLQPADNYELKNMEINVIDSLSQFGQFIFIVDRESENEFMEFRMFDAENNQIWYDLQRFFYRQEGSQIIYRFNLPAEKLEFEKLTISFRNIREPIKIKKATFSTHYSLY